MISQAREAASTGRVVLSLDALAVPLLTGLGAALTYLFGAEREAVLMFMVLALLDLITGVMAAALTGTLHPDHGWRMTLRKLLMLGLVIVGNIADKATTGEPYLVKLVIAYLVANEALSILRNCEVAGVPIPKQLAGVLTQMRDKADQQSGDRRRR